ncbi:MAG: fibronectin type III domain-containing protein, partial [Robiginitomaculum sp.]|nr:fibronectin type III domain-containing protein [Robiginitomaculum sp.]
YSYRIYAISTAGTGDSSGVSRATTFDVAQPGTGLSIGATATSLQLTWAAPEDTGGTPITGYVIERKVVGGEFEVLVANAVSTSTLYLDINLPSDTTYTYRVSTINIAGTSDPSDTAIESTLGSPSAPLGLEAVAGKGKVQLKWGTPFNDGGEEITDYIIEYKLKTAAESAWTQFVDGVGIELIVLIKNTDSTTYVTNNVEYSFRVSAVNAIGTGDASTVVDAKPSIPGATAAYSLSEIASGQDVFLPHNEAASLDNGGKMTGVKIQPKDKLASFTMTSTFLRNAPTGVDGDKLGADMYMKFELNYVVESEISSTAPGTPTGMSVTSSIPNQVSISWSAPSDDGGADISGYKIERSSTPRNSVQSGWTVLAADTKSTATSYTDGGLTNGDAYHYRVSAINAAGTSTASTDANATPIDVPGAPLNVAVTSAGDATVSLSWSTPSSDSGVTVDDGGSDITDYVVEFNNGSGWETFDEGVGVGTTATVTGLTNGDNYSFRIFASNAKGTIYPSLIVSEVPSTVTTVARSLTAIPMSSTEISLSWSAPVSDGGSPITGYQIERKDGSIDSSSSWSIIESASSTSTALTAIDGDGDSSLRLFAGTTYSYRVSAINSDGVGTASSIVQGTTHSVPDAPTGLTAVSLPSKYILSWTPPVNDGGRDIFDYIIQSSTDGGTTWKTLRDNVDSNTSYSVSGSNAVNGQTYTLRVFAVNLVGTGSPSTTFDVKPVSVPQAPRSLDTTPATGQITLNWVAPLSNGGETITAYNIISEIEDADGTYSTINPTITHTSPTAITAVVSGITDGNKYKFQVSATSSVGTGPASIPSIETVGTLTNEHDDDAFTSIDVTFLLGSTGSSTHPTVPNNSHADAAAGFVCPSANVYFITDGGETVFDGITIVRAPGGDTATQCAYTASLPHFSTYGINIQVDSKFAVGAAGLAVGQAGIANVPIPPIITGLAMYSFGAPTLNEDGQLVFAKTGSYQSLPEYSQTLPTTTLKTGEPSQIAVRIFDYNGPDAVVHVGLHLNLHGIEYESEDSDTYILYDKGEDFTLVDPNGLLSNVNVTPRVENEILWILFDMTFEENMDTSNINVNAWNYHLARAEKVSYEILKVSDLIPELEKITGASGSAAGGSGSVANSFYVVESVTETCDVACYSPFEITLNENEIEWANLDESIRTIISGDPIGGFDGFFKSNFIFQDNSYSATIENTGYYSMYDLLEEQYHSAMIVEVSGDPISDARLLEKPTMPYDHTATKIVSGSSLGVFALDVSLPGTIRVFGDFYDVDTRQAVLLDITQPDGTIVSLKLSSLSDGHFSTIQTIPDDWEDGLYTVKFGGTNKHVSSIYFKLVDGKILPLFTPSTSVVANAEIIAEIATVELTLLHTSTLGRGGNLLIAEGQVDSSYS